jgi:hypothetical protein
MALGHITEIRVKPAEGGVRVTVTRKTDIGRITTSLLGSDVQTTMADIKMRQESKEREIKLFRQKHFPESVTWSPIEGPQG